MQKWEQLSTQIVLDTPFFNIRKDVCRLPDGREIDDYYVMQNPDIALIVALTEAKEFVLVEQYKHGIAQICLETPGGLCEPNSDDVFEDAKRELQEETGYVSDHWHKLATFVSSPTRANHHVHLYLALSVYCIGEQSLDPNEDITIRLIAQHDMMPMIRSGKINVPDSVSGLMLALDWLSMNKDNKHE